MLCVSTHTDSHIYKDNFFKSIKCSIFVKEEIRAIESSCTHCKTGSFLPLIFRLLSSEQKNGNACTFYTQTYTNVPMFLKSVLFV